MEEESRELHAKRFPSNTDTCCAVMIEGGKSPDKWFPTRLRVALSATSAKSSRSEPENRLKLKSRFVHEFCWIAAGMVPSIKLCESDKSTREEVTVRL